MPLFKQFTIGLDISDRSIEAVLVVRKGLRFVLSSYGRTVLLPGLVVDGFIERQEDLSVIVRKLLADLMTPPLPRGLNRVVLALPESQVYTHIFEVPRVADEAELSRSLAFEADAFFPYNHQELAASRTVIGLHPDKKEVFYAAAHKETLKGFLSLLAGAGLHAAAIEPESTAVARAVLAPNEADPVAILDIGARTADLSVFDMRGIQFSESLETAGDAFDDAFSRALGLSKDEAEELKKSQGFAGDLDSKARKAIEGVADGLVADIREALAWYEERSKRPVRRLMLCGGTAMMPGFLEFLAKKLPRPGRELRVTLADPWVSLDIDPKLDALNIRARGPLVATVAGLGLRGAHFRKFADINFLEHPDARTGGAGAPGGSFARRRLPHWLAIGLASLGVLAVALGLWFAIFRLPSFFRGAKTAPPAGASAQPLSVEAIATLGDAFSDEQAVMKAVPVEVQSDAQDDFPHVATTVDGIATGTVRLVNASGAGQPLVAGTRLLSETGVLFRLQERVLVPAHGQTTARMAADRPGASGDVPPGHFTIPGLPAARQAEVYGQTDAPTTGGTVSSGTPLTAEELEAAKQAIAGEKADRLFDLAKAKAGDSLKALRGFFSITGIEVVSGPAVGQPTGSYTLKVSLKGKLLAFDPNQALAILMKKLASPATLGEVSYEVKTYELASGTAIVGLKADVIARPQ